MFTLYHADSSCAGTKTSSPHVRESKTVLDSGFHAKDSGFRALDSSLFQWDLDSVFVIGIPDS